MDEPQAVPESGPEETLTACERCGAEHSAADACPQCGLIRIAAPCDRHPDRDAHGRCVLCGSAVCEKCRPRDEVPALCPDHQRIPVIESWAQVYRARSEVEANLLAENLRAEGIDAQVYSQNDHVFPVDMGELSIVRLLVPVWEYGAALELIRSYMDADGEVGFACPACGEVHEPGAAACASCGAALGV